MSSDVGNGLSGEVRDGTAQVRLDHAIQHLERALALIDQEDIPAEIGAWIDRSLADLRSFVAAR